MSYFEDGPVETLDDQHTQEYAVPRPVGVRLSEFRERITRALANLERGQVEPPGLEPDEELEVEHDVVGEVSAPHQDTGLRGETETAFPMSRRGYEPAAVDARMAELERELEELRAAPPPASINEEIERLGDQTASILVVAHDQARETTRLAQEQADRCVADAAANARAITEQAKRELRELDDETDGVWRDRARLIDDARSVGAALIALADDAAGRFPEEGKTIEVSRIPH